MYKRKTRGKSAGILTGETSRTPSQVVLVAKQRLFRVKVAGVGRLQIIYLDNLTRGDADAILLCCVGRKLTDAGLYTSKWDDDSHTTQSIVIGPVSQGDADAILVVAMHRGLTDQGKYRSVWADEQEK